jgi:hypothetical protein
MMNPVPRWTMIVSSQLPVAIKMAYTYQAAAAGRPPYHGRDGARPSHAGTRDACPCREPVAVSAQAFLSQLF